MKTKTTQTRPTEEGAQYAVVWTFNDKIWCREVRIIAGETVEYNKVLDAWEDEEGVRKICPFPIDPKDLLFFIVEDEGEPFDLEIALEGEPTTGATNLVRVPPEFSREVDAESESAKFPYVGIDAVGKYLFISKTGKTSNGTQLYMKQKEKVELWLNVHKSSKRNSDMLTHQTAAEARDYAERTYVDIQNVRTIKLVEE